MTLKGVVLTEKTERMVLAEGKTKVVLGNQNPLLVLMRSKNILTAGDGVRSESLGVAESKTRQAKNVFNLLERNGIPTAYISQEDSTTLLCHKCEMMPIEFIMRRYAWGTFLKRVPHLASKKPFKLKGSLLCEFFHKHTAVSTEMSRIPFMLPESEARKWFLKSPFLRKKWSAGVYTDPLILPDENNLWGIYPKDAPPTGEPILTIQPLFDVDCAELIRSQFMVPCFEALEDSWLSIDTEHGPVVLADMKIELGRRISDGQLVIADVIDNDSWRIWPGGNPKNQIDKQCFRDGDPLSEITEKYKLVAELTDRF
jgi:phosphoribosylaminoimidazole-succinocarboxamide synthase